MTTRLGIDIGGSGIKGAPVDVASGALLVERIRIPTPQPSTPDAVAGVVAEIARGFDWTGPIGAAFPAVVRSGVVHTANNVDQSWIGTDAAALFSAAAGTKVIVLNDADAAGVAAVLVPRDRAAGLTPVVRKVAAGAADTVPLVAVVNLARTLRELKERGVWLVGTDDSAEKTLYEADLKGPVALVMGSEGEGMRRLTRECCDQLVSIPMAGAVESLNVSVAAGVALFEAVRQRSAKK